MTEIFAHNITVSVNEDTSNVYEIHGIDWEGEPFVLFVNDEEAHNLLVQLGFHIS